jgi:hypothetical protein
MSTRLETLPTKLTFILLLALTLCACQSETLEVTRIQVLERRVIERVVVTVEVTRLQPVTVTPRPTRVQPATPTPDVTADPSPTPTPASDSSTRAPATPISSARETGETLLTALKDVEQALLSLVPALNSQPLPTGNVIQLYDALRGAPAFDIPEGETDLLSIYLRYRQQVEYVPDQGKDLYSHLTKIQSGEADQTGISTIHLSVAQDAASTGTSTIQGLIRELEAYLASLP